MIAPRSVPFVALKGEARKRNRLVQLGQSPGRAIIVARHAKDREAIGFADGQSALEYLRALPDAPPIRR